MGNAFSFYCPLKISSRMRNGSQWEARNDARQIEFGEENGEKTKTTSWNVDFLGLQKVCAQN